MRVCVCLGPKAPLANYQVGEQSSGCVAPCSPRPPSLGATPPPSQTLLSAAGSPYLEQASCREFLGVMENGEVARST